MTRSRLIWMVIAVTGGVGGAPGQTSFETKRAHTLIRDPETGEWIETQPPAPGTPQGDLHQLRLRLNRQDYRDVVKGADAWVKTHGQADPDYPDVLLIKSQALIGLRSFDKAHDALRAFLNEFDHTPLMSEALRQEFVIAEVYLSGVKREFLGLKILSGEDKALEILDEISTRYPGDKNAELAIKTKADYFHRTGDPELAEIEYVRLLTEYPQSRYHRHALRRAADSAQATFAGVRYDDSALIEAQFRYEEYRNRYPDEARSEGVDGVLNVIRQQRAMKDLETARYYERAGHPNSAIHYYRLTMEDWPDTVAAAQAQARLRTLEAAPAPRSLPSEEAPATPAQDTAPQSRPSLEDRDH